jgi:hypothetical protein
MRPNLKDLQDIWLLIYARDSMREARRYLVALDQFDHPYLLDPLDDPEAHQSVCYRGLRDAAIIAYARPFTRCNLPLAKERRIALEDMPPPVHLEECHRHLMRWRHTLIGHKDATPADGWQDTPNKVVVAITISGEIHCGSRIPTGKMSPETRDGFGQLCTYFVDQCQARIFRWQELYKAELMINAPGEYEMVISEPDDAWLIPAKYY